VRPQNHFFQPQNNSLPAEANRKWVACVDKRTLEYLRNCDSAQWSYYCLTRRCWLIY